MKRILFVIFFLLWCGSAIGKTVYVKWDATGAANGTSWTDAYTTVSAGVAGMVSGDNMIISGGLSGHTYNEAAISLIGDRHIFGATDEGHNGEVVIDGTGVQTTYTMRFTGVNPSSIKNVTLISDATTDYYALVITNTGFVGENLTIRNSKKSLSISDGSATLKNVKLVNCRDQANNTVATGDITVSAMISNLWLENSGRFLLSGVGEISIVKPIVINGVYDVFVISGGTPVVNIYDPMIIGTPSTISGSNGRDVLLNNVGAGATFNVYKPHVLMNVNSLGTYEGFGADVTVVGTNIDDNPKFKSLRRPVLVSVAVDDYYYKEYFEYLVAEADKRGVPATWNVNTRTDNIELTEEQYAELQSYLDAGHGISSHGRAWYGDVSNFDGIDIQYTGDAATAAMTFANNVLTITTTGGVDDQSLTITNYATLTAAIAAIDALSNFTAVLHTENQHLDANPTQLADVNDQDIKTAAYHWMLDETRHWDQEITGSKHDLETNLVNFTAKSWVYPQNGVSNDVMQALYDRGYIGAAAPGGTINLEDIYAYKIKRFSVGKSYEGSDISVDNIARDIAAIVHMAAYNGGAMQIYAHGGVNQEQFGQLLDALLDNGATIMTLADIVDYIIANADTTSGAEGQLKYQLLSLGDSSDYSLQSDSPDINAGSEAGILGMTGRQVDWFGHEYFFAPYDRLNIGPDQEYSDAYLRPNKQGIVRRTWR